jgi:hypothetical protein
MHHRHYQHATAVAQRNQRRPRRGAKREPREPRDKAPRQIDLAAMERAANLPVLGPNYPWVGDGADYCA